MRNPLRAGEKASNQRMHPGFETKSKHHQKSKTGVSVAPQKGHVTSKNFKKLSRNIGRSPAGLFPNKKTFWQHDVMVIFCVNQFPPTSAS